jgi:hypothetical protein
MVEVGSTDFSGKARQPIQRSGHLDKGSWWRTCVVFWRSVFGLENVDIRHSTREAESYGKMAA